jgi:hypothetical protein
MRWCEKRDTKFYFSAGTSSQSRSPESKKIKRPAFILDFKSEDTYFLVNRQGPPLGVWRTKKYGIER